MGLRKGGFAGVLLVAVGAALWGTDGILRFPLVDTMSPTSIVFAEHAILAAYSIPAVILGWRAFRGFGAKQWAALLVVGWGGSALGTLLFTAAFAVGNPTVAILLQKTQPLFAVLLAGVLLGERVGWRYWLVFAAAVVGAYLVSFGDLSPFGEIGRNEVLTAALALGAALMWGSSTVLGRFVLRDLPFHTLAGARLLTALPLLTAIVLLQGSLGDAGAGFSAEPGRLIL
ncbi:MAG: EamA family transporter, partial [Rubrobacteraceae bacterium]